MQVVSSQSQDFCGVRLSEVERSERKRTHSDNDTSDDDQSTESPTTFDGKRAHHNELERRRRDYIKDHFMALKKVVPFPSGIKPSRAQILKRAVDHINAMNSQIKENKANLDYIKLEMEMKMRGNIKSVNNSPPSYQSPLLSPSLPTLPTLPTLSTASLNLHNTSPVTAFPFPSNMSTLPSLSSSNSMPALNNLASFGFPSTLNADFLLLARALFNQTRINTKPIQPTPSIFGSDLFNIPGMEITVPTTTRY